MRSLLKKFAEGLKRTTPTFHALFGKASSLFTRALDRQTQTKIRDGVAASLTRGNGDLATQTSEELTTLGVVCALLPFDL